MTLLETTLLLLPLIAQDPGDDEVRGSWARLSAEDKVEIAQWFSAECERLETFQNGLIGHTFRELGQARYDWPEARPDMPLYDPAVHAPAQPIARTVMSPTSRSARALRERIFRGVPERRLMVGWRYDYSSGSVVRVGAVFDPERIFQNGLIGHPPDLDLAAAIVERRLDAGGLRPVHQAFVHGYADRKGKVCPGVTLYDVWCSGSEMEMPDVECLGLVHDLLGDWDTWIAPIPAAEHDRLYARIGEFFVRARRHRALRTALARSFLVADPVMRDGYGPSTDRLHSFWDRHRSEPGQLVGSIPDGMPSGAGAEEWKDWWEETSRALDNDLTAYQAGQARKAALQADSAKVRKVLIGVMREYGALDG